MPKNPKNLSKTQPATEIPIESPKRIVNTIDEVLGLAGKASNSKYGTFDPDVYKKQLDSYSEYELYSHGQSIGIRTSDNRELAVRTLMNEFLIYIRPYTAIELNKYEQNISGEDIQRIMNAGK